MKPQLFLLAVLPLLVSTWIPLSRDPATLERGRDFHELFRNGETERIWDAFSPQMRTHFGDAGKLRAFQEQATAQLGAEVVLVDERATRVGEDGVYVRLARFEKYAGVIQARWVFDAEGKVTGLLIAPQSEEAPSEHLEYETKTELRLPFEGEWHVFWGGRSVAQNYHAAYADQRFAYDLLVVKDGTTRSGTGARNEDYHCFGRRILTPGQGRVVAAVDGVPDNVPGEMNPRQPLGNHVILDHGNGEFSFLAHLKAGSVGVKEGSTVRPGDPLGLCGNSGNSSEPHLHYHLQTTPTFQQGVGLPPQFLDYVADGTAVERGEPVQGQTISPAPALEPGQAR